MELILPDHEAWLQTRREGIGASDAGVLLGMSPYKTNVQLWEEKVGLRVPEDISDKPYVQYGHDAEPHLRALFALDHPELEVKYDSPYKIIRNDSHPFIQASPDGELVERGTGRKGGLEIKTTEIRAPTQWKEWDGRIPETYYCQVLWQMLAIGWEFVWLKAQIKWHRNGELRLDTREYLIERDEVLDDLAIAEEAGIDFWKHVQEKKRPALKLPVL